MKPSREDEAPELDRLREELHQLERRVEAIEHGVVRHVPVEPMGGPLAALPDYSIPGAIPVAGRAVLGLAGAFLLRALAESGSVPRLLVVAAAIIYAAVWLVYSVRTLDRDAFAGTIYGVTAALILAPLLWESTLRFHVLPPLATAAILVAYLVLSSALAWPKSSGALTTVTTLATLATAIALMVQTGDMVPFAAALLAAACLVEASACRGHARNMRVPVAIAADFAIWLLVFIMTRPSGVPQSYKPPGMVVSITLGALLFLIYAASVLWQSDRAISVFEIVQLAAAAVLAGWGAMMLTQGRAVLVLGGLCAAACAVCYWFALLRLKEGTRNRYVFAACAAVLGLVASIFLLPEFALTAVWSVAAVAAMLAGSSRILLIQGSAFLIAAGLTSGIPLVVLNAFAGDFLDWAPGTLCIAGASAVCCYGACFRKQPPAALALVPALFGAIYLGALVILTAMHLATGAVLATSRTLVVCGLALALGFAGARMGRRELTIVSYVAIGFGTVKLLMEDFRQSSAAAIAISLVCYGAVLILAPKMGTRRL